MMYFLVDVCVQLGPVIKIVKAVYVLLQWAIPIILILFGAIDLGKAVIASKEDEMKKAQSTLIKRIVYAVIIFFLFSIVSMVIGLVGDANDDNSDSDVLNNTDWATCWKDA